MKTLTTLLSVLLVCACAIGQEVPPALMVRVPAGEPGKTRLEPMRLARVAIEAKVFGPLTETKMTMTFANPHNRVLAGDLYFPLPEGSTVSGYALDVGGRMVDGVVVEKHQARIVFEKEVRKGVDPGLVEYVKGNSFRTRVFPIPAKGTRTVAVSYVGEVEASPDAARPGASRWRLPLRFKQKVSEMSLRVEVVKAPAAPVVVQGGPPKLKFEKWRDSFVASAKGRDVALTQDLIVELPDAAKQKVLVEKAPDGQVYFCLTDRVAAPPAARAAAAPSRVAIFWDASASCGESDHVTELNVLAAYFARWKDRKIDVDLVVFRNVAERPRRFVIEGGDASKLVQAVGEVRYDGGTQIGALALPAGSKPDLCLLFTDGLSNLGREKPGDLGAAVYVFCDSAAANHSFLRYLARSTGGRYFNLKRHTAPQAATAIGSPAFSLLTAKADAEATDLFPSIRRPVAAGRMTVAGRLQGKAASIQLAYGYGGGGGPGGLSHTFEVSRDDAAEGSLLRRYWAQKKLDELMLLPDRNQAEITALGKDYSLVTPHTSLIVLETLAQYLEHRIRPPKSLPKMRQEWERRMDSIEMQKKQQTEKNLERIVGLWKQRVTWWNREFKYPKDFKYRPKPPKKDQAGGEATPDVRPGTAPPPRSAPRPTTPSGERPARRTDGGRPVLGEPVGKGRGRRGGQPGIALKEWDPKTPYLAAMKAAKPAEQFTVYLEQRKKHGTSPAFFLDCADFFRRQKQPTLGLQVLSNIAEMELESPALLRVLGHRLAQLGELDLAVLTFERVLGLRPEEPQSYRDLALVLAARAQKLHNQSQAVGDAGTRHLAASRADYFRAVELLYHVVTHKWDRFNEIELIALMELNTLLPKARAAGLADKDLPVDKRLIALLDLDLRIVLTWDADQTDIDLHVIEPSGERAYYSHNRTTIGGLVSRDFTNGYGPEEYLLKKAMHGTYQIKAKYYGSRAAKLLGAVTIQLEIITHFGRSSEKRKSITLRLTGKKEMIDVGVVEF